MLSGISVLAGGSCNIPSTLTTAALSSFNNFPMAFFQLPKYFSAIFSVSTGEQTQDQAVFGHTRSYPREFLSTETNEPLLRELARAASGKYAPSPAEVFARPERKAAQPHDATSYLLAAALILFPVDIWLRRRTWRGQ